MRKQDYATLAALVRDEVQRCKDGPESRAVLDALARIARSFARRASVEPAAFLRACGLE